ncbi:histone-lysine N-methyltransferase CLF-like [Bidens hawaiensis]|uniref:histone-lysine N-methyltransferase CLF-like n=1 Tax=Bidens hawaiensis TaxID=980011 RepID=UPI00404A38F5
MGVSDVAGWGAFVRHAVERDEFLGEYTGELISHEEADLRGVLYDHANSYLFNLNDEYVIDSYRQGNKLKFANHSTNPNCYARVIKVGGEDRISIFAKKRIEEGEEIFLDYCYDPEHSFPWTHKPDDATEGPSSPRSKNAQPDGPKESPSVPPQERSKTTQPRH